MAPAASAAVDTNLSARRSATGSAASSIIGAEASENAGSETTTTGGAPRSRRLRFESRAVAARSPPGLPHRKPGSRRVAECFQAKSRSSRISRSRNAIASSFRPSRQSWKATCSASRSGATSAFRSFAVGRNIAERRLAAMIAVVQVSWRHVESAGVRLVVGHEGPPPVYAEECSSNTSPHGRYAARFPTDPEADPKAGQTCGERRRSGTG